MLSADLNERALAGNSNNKYQCISNCTKLKNIKDSHVRKYTGRGCLGSNPRFFFNYRIANRAYVWICVSVLLSRIEVCLRSELWPVMAHQPNSWSKHPGTQIEQVLAYCRDEQKYVGCIELLFCLTLTMTFGVRTWKFIGLMDEILPIYQPNFTEIRSKIREK